MAKHGCCADKACNDRTCMELPAGKTCGDCVHVHRCVAIFGHTPVDTYCDWFPRRFNERAPVAGVPPTAPSRPTPPPSRVIFENGKRAPDGVPGTEQTHPFWCHEQSHDRPRCITQCSECADDGDGVQDRFGDADLAPGKHGGTVALMPSGVAPCGGCHKPPELTCAHFKAASGVSASDGQTVRLIEPAAGRPPANNERTT